MPRAGSATGPGNPREPARDPARATGDRATVIAALDAAPPSSVFDVDGNEVAVTHLDRVYWPAHPPLARAALTKRAYLRYLVLMSPWMLPHLADRPLKLFRWPEGVDGRRVLMKHWEIALPAFVERVDVFSESKGRPDQYILCNNLATLVWLGHMGTLEFHAWHSRITGEGGARDRATDFASSLAALQSSTLERPDYLLFDIDPFIYSGRETRAKQPEFSEAAFDRSRDVAYWLKEVLDGMRLASFVKTSGKTGLHVVVPIDRTLRYEAIREVARVVAAHVARAHRDTVTVDWSVDRRTGKIFIDYNMNVRGKSMTTPYSPRGLAGAPVSMPVAWSALGRVHAYDFTLESLLSRRPARDAWSTLERNAQDLAKSLGASSR